VVADNTKLYEGVFKTGFDHLDVKMTEIQPLSDDMAMATGESRITGKNEKGDPLDVTVIWTDVLVRENGQWKIRMLTSLPKPPPQPQQAAK
jgi:ketosteroid isomerase-like protein